MWAVAQRDTPLRAQALEPRELWGVSMLYSTHDLLSARIVTDNILVLNQGAVVERGDTAEVLRHPTDEYTIKLLDSIPNPRKKGAA